MKRRSLRNWILKRLPTRYGQKPWVRILVMNPAIFLSLGLCGAMGLLAAVMVVKIWTATPRGFEPVVKLSLLDRAQAWALGNRAAKHAASGNFDDAFFGWHAALAQNPADVRVCRQMLECLVKSDRAKDREQAAFSTGRWLLQLTSTNETDVNLVVKAWSHVGLHEPVLELLQPKEDDLSTNLEAAYLKALFHSVSIAAYGDRRKDHPVKIESTPEFELYDIAWNCGFGPQEGRTRAREGLRRYMEDPKLGGFARRLDLNLCGLEKDVAGYRTSLDSLVRSGRDRFADHIGYWELLIEQGRKEDAKGLIQGTSEALRSSSEAVRLVNLWVALDSWPTALDAINRHSELLGRNPHSAWATGTLLLTSKRGDAAWEFALRMRSDTSQSSIKAISYYLEARAEIARERREVAAGALQKMLKEEFPTRMMAWQAAEALVADGFAGVAGQLLTRQGNVASNNVQYCQALVTTALRLHDAPMLLDGADGLNRLQPNADVAFTYAAALLINRKDEATALKIIWEYLQRYPASVSAQVNYAVALVRQGRFAEARVALGKLDATRLDADHRHSFHFAQLELFVAEGRLGEARNARAHVADALLFGPERAWLAAADKLLGAK